MCFLDQVLVLVVIVACQTAHANQVSLSDGGELPDSFGSAKRFHPLPGTIIASHCTWEVKLNTVYNRIPQTITEILCHNPNEVCGGNSNYHCRQIRSKMLVGYTEGNNIVNLRNNTVSIGCSCVRRPTQFVENFGSPIIQKRGRGGGGGGGNGNDPMYPM